ncbi:unnamed protein product, partial [Polarella glacialis]
DHSYNADYLRLAVVVPDSGAATFQQVYEGICKRAGEVSLVKNRLTDEVDENEKSAGAMFVLLHCRLASGGHVFEVQIRFASFDALIPAALRGQHTANKWLSTLRRLHPFLPGEPDHYQGQLKVEDGEIEFKEPRPANKLPGLPDGRGIMFYSESGDCYQGDFRVGYPHGQGLFRYAKGEVYEGGFKAGKKHGQGILRYNDLDIYEGSFRADKKHGPGIYHYADGSVEVGNYAMDSEVYPQVVWNAERSKSWLLVDQEQLAPVDPVDAVKLAKDMGFEDAPPSKPVIAALEDDESLHLAINPSAPEA